MIYYGPLESAGAKVVTTQSVDSPQTSQIIYANQPFPTSQYILQPLNLPPVSGSATTTPQRMVIKSTPTGLLQA